VQLEQAKELGELTFQTGVFVQSVLPDSPAAKALITHYERILTVNGTAVSSPEDVIRLQAGAKTVIYTLEDLRVHTVRTASLALQDGKAGISLVPTRIAANRRSFFRSVTLSLHEVWFTTKQTILGLGTLVRSLSVQMKVPEGITGVVGIAILTHASVQEGFMVYLQLVAMLSLSLAILNILPFPALDGGRMVFVFAEILLRRRVNQQVELLVNAAGFFILFALIVIITFNDVIHLF
jgi:regulator of sigma E protease